MLWKFWAQSMNQLQFLDNTGRRITSVSADDMDG